ncbi:hypothetical protein Tco_0067056 [Tanacetum coccineum]
MRARNNDYEFAEKSPKRGNKVGIELVILELLDLKREKERPLSSLVNKEGQTKVGIEMLFDGKAPSFRIANTLENYNRMEESVTRLVLEVATAYRYGGLYGRIEYVGVQSDLNHDDGLVVCNQLVQECPGLDDKFIGYVVEANGELISSATLVFALGGVKVIGIWGCEDGMKLNWSFKVHNGVFGLSLQLTWEVVRKVYQQRKIFENILLTWLVILRTRSISRGMECYGSFGEVN